MRETSIYKVILSEYGPTVYVEAYHEAEAMDEAIDLASDNGWVGLFLDADDIQEIESEDPRYLEDYYQGGNEGKYLSSFNVRVVEV
jgi:hypothetical protein